MALKFQYNKTTIQTLKKQLSIRQKALPILQNKETALRKEIKLRQEKLKQLEKSKNQLMKKVREQEGLWAEFPRVLNLNLRKVEYEKVIGVKVPKLIDINVNMAAVSWWHFPAWVPTGIQVLKEGLNLKYSTEVIQEQILILDEARKKTTQKVNLYEKVQIPEMEDAIMKIKRFLEDKENIAKAAQKIMKSKRERSEAA